MEDFSKQYEQLASVFELELRALYPGESSLYRAMSYSLAAGGKRLRPVLTLATERMLRELVGLSVEKPSTLPCNLPCTLPFALAVELLHTASLVHDDLPALDDDDLRRGKPSSHIVFGEAVAILSGDALISSAFGVLARGAGLSATAQVELIKLLSKAFEELCLGQVLDVESFSTNLDHTEDSLEAIKSRHQLKTGALILACVEAPVIVLNSERCLVKSEYIQALRSFGVEFGALFQLVDDLIDVVHPASFSGKTAATDSRHGLPTYVSLLGLDQAIALAHALHRRATASLAIFEGRAYFHHQLCDEVLRRSRVQTA